MKVIRKCTIRIGGGHFDPCFLNEIPLSKEQIEYVHSSDSPDERNTKFTNPSARAGYETKSIFKRNLTGLNSEFSFS